MSKEVQQESPIRKKWKLYLALALILIAVIAVIAAAAAWRSSRALKAQLSEAEKKLELREDAMAALEKQQSEQTTLIENLQNKIEELLNVEEPAPVVTEDQLQEQINSVRELVVKEYIYTNAARRESSKTWLWGWTLPFSDSSLLVTYDGTIRAGIDLGKVEIDVNETSRSITVTLPSSEILSNEIPQETINVLEVKNGLFNEVTFDGYNEFISAEKEAMQEKVIARGLLTDADSEARSVIRNAVSLLPGIDAYKLDVKTK